MLPPIFPESAGFFNLRWKTIRSPCTCTQTKWSWTDGKVDINTLSHFIFVCLNAVIFPLFVKHGARVPEGLFTFATANAATNSRSFYTNEIMLFKENLSLFFFCASTATCGVISLVWFIEAASRRKLWLFGVCFQEQLFSFLIPFRLSAFSDHLQGLCCGHICPTLTLRPNHNLRFEKKKVILWSDRKTFCFLV